ncbi:MAG: DUF5011 domain-containing protein [Candidatus Methanoperedens sp.]|nr:MAG: DUF5011 domain-containing protein [Candidatus Methanoperedens sp.]
MSNHIAGGQTNKWGRDWTRDEIVNNLRVQANWIGSTSGRLTYLPVRIYYTEAVDITPPVITLTGLSSVTVEAGSVYTDAGATAQDNIDGDLTSSIVTGGLPVNTNVLGPHTVTYDVTDFSGTVIDSVPAHTPLAGVIVSTTGGILSVTDGSGKYSLVVNKGSYPLAASYDIRYYTNSSVTVSTTGFTSVTQDIELELKPTGNITGVVSVNV